MTKLNIIHVDMDAFFASVEQRDQPMLRNKPVVVGGDPRGRGVVSTASYEARKYGIHSAMPCKQAAELCPDLIFLPVQMKKYKEASRIIHSIFRSYTPIIEPISIDEAFLEIKEGDSIDIGQKIKNEIYKSLNLTASVGVSYNKFIAKMASDMKKPNGFTVITQEEAKRILPGLPIRKIWGVGEKTEKELNKIGIFSVLDLLQYDHDFLLKKWGRRAYDLIQLCRGIDHSQVQVEQETKSMSEETTLREDTKDLDILINILKNFSLTIGDKLARDNMKCRTITVKIRYKDFQSITRSYTFSKATDSHEFIFENSRNILLNRVPLLKPLRLIGLQVSNLVYPDEPDQISFM